MNLAQVTKLDEEQARDYLESIRWPNGPVCPHCGGTNAGKLAGESTRPGVYKCKTKECRKQFTVTVGTIFERSHISLREWVIAFHMMCASKKGVSAHQIHRMVGCTYKSAWFMCHRIRHAMKQGPMAPKMKGVVEADETYVGGKTPRIEERPRDQEDPGSPSLSAVARCERCPTANHCRQYAASLNEQRRSGSHADDR